MKLGLLLLYSFLIPLYISKETSVLYIRKLNRNSEIIITIFGNGSQRIINNYVFEHYKPSEIIINGEKANEVNEIVNNLINEENIIIYKWNYLLTTCEDMFSTLTNIIKIDLSNFDSSNVRNMINMFSGCTSLTSINFNNFDTSLVTNMAFLFYQCHSLISLDLSNFNTTSVEIMVSTFCECISLKSLYLNSFDTSSVTNMYGMFLHCDSLESLYIDNFNTSLVTDMGIMFVNCASLTSLNLKSFNTSSVINMESMFYGCQSLTSLDLQNFDTSLVTSMESMFYDCNSLISLNLSNFNTSLVIDMSDIFSQCYSLELLDITNFNTSLIINMDYFFAECNSLTTLDLSNFDTSSTISMVKMFYNCSSLRTLNLNNFKTSSLSNMMEMFSACNNELIYCVNNKNNQENKILKLLTDNFFYNNNCSFFCFIQSKKYIFEKEKCLLNCFDDNNYKYEYNNKCYISCPNGTKISSIDNYLCEKEYLNSNIIKNSTLETINIIDIPKTDNISDISNYSLDPYSDINYFKYLCHIKDNLTSKDDIIKKLRNEFNKGNLDILISNNIEKQKEDLIANENGITYQITSTYNQKNNEYINISSINLGECETKLRIYYHINNNITLLIFKVEIKEEGLLIPIIEYEVYNPETKEKLNLELCENIKTYISIPVSIDENNLFKYNVSNEFYNDLCHPYTTVHKTDIILKDRRNEFIKNNLSLCEKDCEYHDYNFKTKKVSCECYIKINFPLISEISINKEKLMNKFVDLKKTINISILKCYKLVFNLEGLIHNIGSYILLSIILIIFILAFIFRIKGYQKFIQKVNKIIKRTINNNINDNSDLINNKKINNNKIKKETILKKIEKKGKMIKNNYKKMNKNNPPLKKIKSKNINNKRIKCNNTSINKTNSALKSKRSNIYINVKKNQNFNISIFNMNKSSKKNKNKINNKQYLITYNDYELNNLSYQNASKIDKRSYIQYYISLLKTKHLFIFTFYTHTDYNSQIIKICLFLFSFALFYTVNALFFNDSTIHKIYEDKGSFDFIYQIPKILYSSFISSTINTIVRSLSLSEKSIIRIKNEKNNIKKRILKLLKCLIIKFILFFIITLLFLIIFWYYLSCFCAVYKNTQIHLIKDVLISFGISLMYPFGLNLFPGIFRISSLRDEKKNRKCLYNFSKIIQLI